MISDFFTKTFTVKRQVWATDGSGNKYSSQSTIGTFKGHIQQAEVETVEYFGLTFSKAYTIWCGIATNVAEGDAITEGSKNYTVKAIIKRDVGNQKHLELVVQT